MILLYVKHPTPAHGDLFVSVLINLTRTLMCLTLIIIKVNTNIYIEKTREVGLFDTFDYNLLPNLVNLKKKTPV